MAETTNLFQSLFNPPSSVPGPQRQFAPPSTPQMWQQQLNKVLGGNQAALAQQNNAINQSQGARFGAAGRYGNAAKNRNNMMAAIGNQQARVQIPMQGQQMYSQYMNQFDNAAEEAFQARQREAIARQQLGVSAISPLMSALVGLTG